MEQAPTQWIFISNTPASDWLCLHVFPHVKVLLPYSLTSEVSRAGPYCPLGIQHELRSTSVVCLIPRRLSLSMKMCAQRKAGRRQWAFCTLPMVPCSSSPVIYLGGSCEKRSAWGGGWSVVAFYIRRLIARCAEGSHGWRDLAYSSQRE